MIFLCECLGRGPHCICGDLCTWAPCIYIFLSLSGFLLFVGHTWIFGPRSFAFVVLGVFFVVHVVQCYHPRASLHGMNLQTTSWTRCYHCGHELPCLCGSIFIIEGFYRFLCCASVVPIIRTVVIKECFIKPVTRRLFVMDACILHWRACSHRNVRILWVHHIDSLTHHLVLESGIGPAHILH